MKNIIIFLFLISCSSVTLTGKKDKKQPEQQTPITAGPVVPPMVSPSDVTVDYVTPINTPRPAPEQPKFSIERLSTEQIKTIEDIQEIEKREKQKEEQAKKMALLKEDREMLKFDTCLDTEIPQKEALPAESLLNKILKIPRDAFNGVWEEYVEIPNAMDRAARFLKTPVYFILLAKIHKGIFKVFIDDLNKASQTNEGYTWIMEAIQETIRDKKVHIALDLMSATAAMHEDLPKRILPENVSENLWQFLNNHGNAEREEQAKINEEYALKTAALTNIMQRIDRNHTGPILQVPQTIERDSYDSALELTKKATNNYLPSITLKK